MDGSSVIKALFLTLGIDSSRMDKDFADATKRAKSGLATISSVIKQVAAPIMGALTIGDAFKTYLQGADALGSVSKSLNLAADDVQAFGQAVEAQGGNMQSFFNSLQSVNSQLQFIATTGNGRAKAAFDALGISVKDANGKTKQATDLLFELADKAQSMDSLKFTSLAQRIGIDKSTIGALKEGRTELEKNIKQQKERLRLTEYDIKETKEYKKNLEGLTRTFKAVFFQAFRIALPIINPVIKELKEFFDFLCEQRILVSIIAIATVITGKLIPAFLKLAVTMAANPFTWLIVGLATLALLIEDFIFWVYGGESALGKFWEKFGKAEDIKKKLNAFFDNIQNIGGKVKKIGKDILKFIKDVFSTPVVGEAFSLLIDAIKGAWNALKTLHAAFEKLDEKTGIITWLGRAFKTVLGYAIAYVIAFFVLLFNAVEAVSTAISKLIDIFLKAWEKIKGIYNKLKALITGQNTTITVKDETDKTAQDSGGTSATGAGANGGGKPKTGTAATGAAAAMPPARENSVPPHNVSNTTQTEVNNDVRIGKVEVNTNAKTIEGAGEDFGKGVNKGLEKNSGRSTKGRQNGFTSNDLATQTNTSGW